MTMVPEKLLKQPTQQSQPVSIVAKTDDSNIRTFHCDIVQVKVIGIDLAKKRIQLSMKGI